MIFFGLLLLLFAATSALCFFDGEKTRTVWCTFAAVATLLFLLAAFRPVGLDQDSENYVQYYYGNTEQILEFTFTAISALVSFFADSPRGMFVVYALLGILLHTWAVTRSTPFWLLALVVWMGNFYLYQEVTQIRVAVAAGLFLVGLSYLRTTFAGCSRTLRRTKREPCRSAVSPTSSERCAPSVPTFSCSTSKILPCTKL